jgi:hypothetical protein
VEEWSTDGGATVSGGRQGELARREVDSAVQAFLVVKRKDEAAYGSYRTNEKILEIYDEIQEAVRVSAGLAPPDSMSGGLRERRDTDVPAGPQRSQEGEALRVGEYRTWLELPPGDPRCCHEPRKAAKQ